MDAVSRSTGLAVLCGVDRGEVASDVSGPFLVLLHFERGRFDHTTGRGGAPSSIVFHVAPQIISFFRKGTVAHCACLFGHGDDDADLIGNAIG